MSTDHWLHAAADGLSGGPVVGNVFCKLCLLIKESLNQLEKSQLEDLFEAVGSVNALVIQNVSAAFDVCVRISY